MPDTCGAAIARMRQAQADAIEAIKADYPIGLDVSVRHYRGLFGATVVRHCGEFNPSDVGYVLVQNNRTGKQSKRYYRDLEARNV